MSWAMQKIDSSAGMSHTVERYRDTGIYSIVHADCLQKAVQSNQTIFAFTAKENVNALHIIRDKFGGKSGADVVFITHKPQLAHL